MRRKFEPFAFLWMALVCISLACQFLSPQEEALFATSSPDLTGTAFFAAILTPTLTQPPASTSTPMPPPVMTQTETPVATPSLTMPVLEYQPQNQVLVWAPSLAIPPVVDGDLADWDQEVYPAKAVVYGAPNWTGSADLSAELMVGWDTNNLYLAARVTDEAYVQNGAAETIFRGDSLEVLLDTNLAADRYVHQLSPDDFQLGISPGSPSPGISAEAYLWFPAAIAGARNRVNIAARKTDQGYQVECLIPWSVFEVAPQAGSEMGFAFSVSDNDLVGQLVQQTMVSLVATRRLTDPTTWGKIVLLK